MQRVTYEQYKILNTQRFSSMLDLGNCSLKNARNGISKEGDEERGIPSKPACARAFGGQLTFHSKVRATR